MSTSSGLTRRDFLRLSAAALLGAAVGPLRSTEAFARELEAPYLESTFLMYHELSAARLRNDLLDYIRRGYQPISLETLVGFFDGQIRVDPAQPTFLVTCDDGLASQYDAVLEATEYVKSKTGWFVPAVFFVMTRFGALALPIEDVPGATPSYNDGVHKYLTKDQIINLIKGGHRVENHTVNHAVLQNLSEGARNAEVMVGEQRIQALWDLAGVDRRYRAFAYPRGRYKDQVDYIRDAGYAVAFSTNRTTAHSVLTRYALGRVRKT